MMELEYQTVMIPIDEQFQNEVQKHVEAKWEVLPGTKPVAIYHLVRIKAVQAAAVGGFGDMKIDDSKIHLIRGGKIIG
jgi:hypothetical protein